MTMSIDEKVETLVVYLKALQLYNPDECNQAIDKLMDKTLTSDSDLEFKNKFLVAWKRDMN